MQCYTELIAPTAVTASICLPFLSSTANNLVIAKTSLLQVFALKSVITDAPEKRETVQNGNGLGKARRERIYTTKLVLVSQFHVSGTITALARVKTPGSKSGGELLLVAIRDAKLSLVEWDPQVCSVATVSIHYYEKEELQSPWAPPLGHCVNCLTVDPRSRCAALKFGARHLAILPFHQAGDDLVMDDFDAEEASNSNHAISAGKTNGDHALTSPYSSSFVLSLLAVDPILLHPIHLAFLYGYREPTLAVLSSAVAPSAALLHERRDVVTYTVYTLDLEQRASTSLLSVTGLPYDAFKISPLPSPIGGALIIGYNEIIHVDQSGKTHGVAVNGFAKQCSSFPLASESHLNLKLEGCIVEQLGSANGELLIILNDGALAVLSFKLDGRAVAGLSITKVRDSNGGSLLQSSASCTAVVGRGRIFVGSEDSDSLILGWSSLAIKSKKPKQRDQLEVNEDDMEIDSEMDFEDENDLYADTKPSDAKAHVQSSTTTASAEDYAFRIHDVLMNLAPLKDIHIIRSLASANSEEADHFNAPLEMVAAVGRGRLGSLVSLSPDLQLRKVGEMGLGQVHRVWSFYAENGASGSPDISDADNTIITSAWTGSSVGESQAYRYTKGALTVVDDKDFEAEAGATIEVASVMGGVKILQVLSNEVRTFDGDFSLSQILPLGDEGSDPEPKVVSASVVEPYILLCRDDDGIMILRIDDSGDLEEVDKGEDLSSTKWRSGSLYDDLNDAFHLDAVSMGDEDASSVLMFLLNCDGGLQIFRLPLLQTPVFSASGLSLLPPYLSPDFSLRRASVRENLTELLVADLGDTTYKSPYLILRSAHDDLTLYWPYQDSTKGDADKVLQFLKIADQRLPKIAVDERSNESHASYKSPLRIIQSSSGTSSVFLPGTSSCLIVKSAFGDPKTIGLRPGELRCMLALNAPESLNELLIVGEDGNASISRMPSDVDCSTGWAIRRLFVGKQICAFDYHEKTKRFVVGFNESSNFKLPEDELHPEWGAEATELLPVAEQDSIAVIDAGTWTVTETFNLEEHEIVTCIKTMSLEVSEITHERRPLVCVGTAIAKGEDITIQGCIYVFDIINVVPEPDRPETGRKLKLLAKVKDKGAVTAVTQIGTEGFLLVAQGQKCLVRGLKEDGTLLPLAFLDTQCYVSVAKELPGTGMCMVGDAVKGLWFVGYTEDPYHLKIFGKGVNHLEVVAAEYLPNGRELYILLIDSDGTLHIHQYDPANPKSIAGQRLLHLSSFNTGVFPSGMTLLPRTRTSGESLREESLSNMDTDTPPEATHQVLVHGSDGSLSLITPLPALTYRTLAALQTHLLNSLPQALGLNPKAYRNSESDLSIGGRAVLDGNVLRRWSELGTWKRAESVSRAGCENEWEVRALLEGISGRGLGFL